MSTVNYTELIKSAKVAARDFLRTEKVQALLGYINGMEAQIKRLTEFVENAKQNIAFAEYELRIATQFESPVLADVTKRTEEARKAGAERIAAYEKDIEECNKKIAEYNTKIENWHNGTSKVDADRMNSLAISFVKDKIGTDFNMGLYTEAEANAS